MSSKLSLNSKTSLSAVFRPMPDKDAKKTMSDDRSAETTDI